MATTSRKGVLVRQDTVAVYDRLRDCNTVGLHFAAEDGDQFTVNVPTNTRFVLMARYMPEIDPAIGDFCEIITDYGQVSGTVFDPMLGPNRQLVDWKVPVKGERVIDLGAILDSLK